MFFAGSECDSFRVLLKGYRRRWRRCATWHWQWWRVQWWLSHSEDKCCQGRAWPVYHDEWCNRRGRYDSARSWWWRWFGWVSEPFLFCSVVTVSLFSRLVGVARCFHEKVGGRFQFRCLYMFTKCLYGFYDVQFGAVGLVGERVVCVHGAYCRAGEVVNWSQSVRASHVMRNPSVKNETFSQLDVHSTENTQIL